MNVVLHGPRIVDPARGVDEVADLAIRDGVIAAWPCEMPTDCLHIDCTGLVLAPAFIDLHCHLREPGFEQKETVATGTAAAAAGGFGAICCMPNTRPALDTLARIREFDAIVRRDAVVTVYPIAAATLGRRGEALVDIKGLAAEGVVGFSDDGDYIADSAVMRDALSQAARVGLPVMDHAQDGGLVSGGVMHEGDAARRLRLRGMPAEAEEVAVGRDIALARMTGGHAHICHITTATAVDMVRRAKSDGVRVTAEATPHHLTLTDEDCVATSPSGAATFNNDAKVNPPLRGRDDVLAVVRGLADGTIDAIATDHAPHTAADKVGSPGEAVFGISVFETALASVLDLYHRGEVSLDRLVYCLTVGPAGVLGPRPPRPSAAPGAPARLALFEPEASWVVDPTRFHSRGWHTPLAGRTMRGMVLATLLDGRFVYVADSLSGRCTGPEAPSAGIHRAAPDGGANPNGC